MKLTLDGYGPITSGLLEREIQRKDDGFRKSETLRWADRVRGWFTRKDDETRTRVQGLRIEVKTVFVRDLIDSVGRAVVDKSLLKNGIVVTNDRPLTNRLAKRVVNEAQRHRDRCVGRNAVTLSKVMAAYGSADPLVRALQMREIRSAEAFERRILTQDEMVEALIKVGLAVLGPEG